MVALFLLKNILYFSSITFVYLVSTEIPHRGWKFNGTSLIVYKTQFRRPIQSMTLDIAINPRTPNGIIMFASRYTNGTGPYILVQMKEGSIEVGLSTGTHSVLLR